jgi:excisionase family DNA binding protein
MLLGAKEVAVLLSVSERTVTRMFKSGEITAFKPNGKLWRTRREIVATYLRNNLGDEVKPATAQPMLRRVA